MSDEFDECGPFLNHLYEFLDGECAEADADKIRAHLEVCDRCVHDADVVLALKALMQRCCRNVAAPSTFKARMLSRYSVSYTYTEIVRHDGDSRG